MSGVTGEGFTIKPLEQIVSDLGARLVARFGSTFDVSPESPDGQLIGVVSDTIFDAWQMGELSYNAFAPSKTFGLGLDNLCELNHVVRQFQTATKITAQMTGSNGVTIPKGSIIADSIGLEFETEQDLLLDSNTDNSVTAVATVTGPNVVEANAVTTIVTAISGWETVTNPEAGVVGNNREEDPQLRNRRAASVITTGVNTNESIYAAMFRLGATYVVVIDNDTGATVDGQPTSTFQCVVEGGSQVEIAEAIFAVKPYGIQAFGDISTSVSDSKGYSKVIGFSRTSRTDIYVSIDFVRNKGASFDSDERISQVVLEHINTLNINEDVVWSDIFEPITSEVKGISIKSLYIGLAASPSGIVDIPLGIKQRAITDVAKVVINDLTP
jgi:uncharacterized phage protein gp47/JayE